MASYTMEDIELIRRKSGISYQEAVALLDYHNGSVARALIDLERNGKLRPETEKEGKSEKKDGKGGAAGFFQKMYRNRVHVRKGGTMILNVSWLFALACVLFSPHMTIAALIVAVILGYSISFARSDRDFANDDLEAMVRDVANNVKSSVGDLAKGVSQGFAQMQAAQKDEAAKADGKPVQSYYQSNPASASAPRYTAPRTGVDVPTMQVPVKVESQDGSVTVETDSEGYGSATIG